MQDSANRAVAVVGVGAVMPDAPDAATFWQNLIDARYSISDVASDRWNPDWYYDADPKATDKTYSKIGGWVRDFEWDPMAWHLPIPPKVATAMDDAQKWAIACTRAALDDYGWPERDLAVERTAVIIGNAMAGENHYRTALRIDFPEFAAELRSAPSFQALSSEVQEALLDEARAGLRASIPDITEDTMPGELANIIAGRVANVFDLHGPNYVTDAACASAIAAIDASIEGLDEGRFDAVITGGIDRNMGAATFVKFSKIGALSATGTRPYAEGADGFVMGEGAALFLLKRLADAERDGDKIYAVIRGVAGASDGRGKGITAPNPLGQRLAVERAWDVAGLDPASATYVEGHGTSTKVGDVVECQGLSDVFGSAGAAVGSIGVGSVKSNIGHLKGAAGAAGILKTVLALHRRQIPPSLSFASPNPDIDFAHSPLRVVDELREWEPNGDGIRRAGVSAFGFGGTNFHAVLEEHVPGRLTDPARAVAFDRQPAQRETALEPTPAAPVVPVAKVPLHGAVVVGGPDDAAVADRLRALAQGSPPVPSPPAQADLAAPVRVAIDFDDAGDLSAKAIRCAEALESSKEAAWRLLVNQGAFLGRGAPPKVAFLYTGQGSQYVNMLAELSATEPIVAAVFDDADRVMAPFLERPLTEFIFTDPSDDEGVEALAEHLKQTEITQPAVLATDLALTRLLAAYGIAPDMVMGHSLGEYGALVAAGSLTFDAALEAVSARGREMADLSLADNGALAAVMAPLSEIEQVLAGIDGYVVVANVNSSGQGVIGGATTAVEEAVERFADLGHTAMRIPVSHAFHTEIVAPATEPLKAALRRLSVREPDLPVVANVTGDFYPRGGLGDERMLDLLGRQVASPVQFVKGLETLYGAGARLFVEVGPKKALHGFAQDVLGEREGVMTLFTNHPKQGDVVSFNRALCGLWAAGHGGASVTQSDAGAPAAPVRDRVVVNDPDRRSGSAPVAPVGDATYLELGHLFAEFLDRGRSVYDQGSPVGDGPARLDEPVVITGAALGLPGTERVFGEDNVRRILDGEQFIDQIPNRARNRILEKHIVRLVKRETGDPTFEEIETPDEVIKLAGRAGRLDLAEEFGVEPDRVAALDAATKLAIGAGIDALRDAGLPLVMHYKTTSVGSQLPERWMLPDELRDDTGVIFAAAFPGLDALVGELDRFHEDKARREQLEMLESLRARVLADSPALAEIEHEMHELRSDIGADPFEFDRRFLFRVLAMGHSQFAELIGARGPNTHVNSACASTTQAVAIAEDWIRVGRCRYVVIIAGDDASSDHLLEWIGSGFLASGAAATDGVVEDAALPFDNRRHGMILGMGAAALVVESRDTARQRGIRPICEVLGAVTANSAFHGTRLDVEHISQVMEQTVAQAEARGVDRHAMTTETVFVSHETYTPARGGSASAEINALREVFGADADRIVIANTKGITGHPMGVGIEDVVAVKALETGIVPPVPNFKEVDPGLGDLNLSIGGAYPVRFALRLAAGFGSQISMMMLRWTPMPDGRHREPDELGHGYRIEDPAAWMAWLERVGGPGAELEVVQHRLRIVDRGPRPVTDPAVESQPRPAAEPASSERAEQPEAAPAAVEVEAPAAVEGDVVVERVLAMVSEVTGYPSDMLDLDLDLEADLGIDTVKQAEVFGSIRESFGIERDDRLQLRDYPTLSHVIGFVRERAEQPETTPSSDTTDPAPHIAMAPPEGSIEAADEIPRRVPVPELRPELDECVPTAVELGAGSRVVVVCDEGGVGAALGGLLEARGVDVLSIDDPTDAETLVSTLEGWRGAGEVDGVYWLPALDVEPPLTELELDTWRVATEIRVKLLHATMRLLYADIDGPERFLIGGTRLGGLHGYGPEGASAPMGGAVTGFVKAFKRERPDALVKAVDVAVEAEPATVAGQLVGEAQHDPGCVEVGYHGDRRWTIGLRQEPAADGKSGMDLGAETVFVITGAAGSIVSAITADLARHSGGTFHLLDLTPEPDPADQDLRQFGEDREELKRAIFNRIKESGERATPARVEEELARLERLDAARAAIEAVEDAGGVARYHSVDLTDGEAVRDVIERVREDHGRIDVLIHAAGLDISRFVPDKEPTEFALVFDVKCDGWINLMSAAADLPIGATVVFSSVAGRFGNGGQVDYSAANDLLCKFSSSFRTTRPETRGIAIDWTAWGDIGMATRGSIPRMMAMAGIEMLPAKAGIAVVRRELTAGGTCGEVVIGGALGILTEEVHPTGGLDPSSIDVTGVGPMVGRVTGMGVYSGLSVETTLDPKAQNFLDDHRIDGIPVLPGVMGVEAFAEVARLLRPDLHVAGVEDVAFRAPLKFYGDEPRDILISAHFRRDAEDLVVDCELIGRRVLANQAEPQVTIHFTGTVRLNAAPPPRPEGDKPPAVEGVILEGDPVYDVYFHGPAYQVLAHAWKTEDGSAGLLSEDLPSNHTPTSAPLTMAPRLIELCFQTAGVWEIGHEGRMALPTGIGRVSTYGDPSTATGRLFAVAAPSGDSLFDCRVVDESGTVFVVMDHYRTIALPSPLADDAVAPFLEAMT